MSKTAPWRRHAGQQQPRGISADFHLKLLLNVFLCGLKWFYMETIYIYWRSYLILLITNWWNKLGNTINPLYCLLFLNIKDEIMVRGIFLWLFWSIWFLTEELLPPDGEIWELQVETFWAHWPQRGDKRSAEVTSPGSRQKTKKMYICIQITVLAYKHMLENKND